MPANAACMIVFNMILSLSSIAQRAQHRSNAGQRGW
jgi:hypothetical protein